MVLDNYICVKDAIPLDEYIEFRESVKKEMEHPDWLGDFTKEDLKSMLACGTKIWIYYDRTTPVCSMMFIPASEKSMKKMDLSYDASICADYGPMMVNKDYLGNHLQQEMIQVLDDYSKKEGCEYAISTVHPDNFYSIKNLLATGFKEVGTKEFSRGIRNIYLKKL